MNHTDVKIIRLHFSWKVVISKTLKSLGRGIVMSFFPSGLLDFGLSIYSRVVWMDRMESVLLSPVLLCAVSVFDGFRCTLL